MSKYIIEVEDNAVGGLFKAKGFNALVFDQNGLDKLQKYGEPVGEVEEELTWPRIGDEFWVITSCGQTCNYFYEDTEFDTSCLRLGNFFDTQKEADFALKRLKVLAEMKKFAEPFDTKWDGCTNHFFIYYSVCNEYLRIDIHTVMRGGELYFESEAKARECIKAVGEDRIKKYYLGVE